MSSPRRRLLPRRHSFRRSLPVAASCPSLQISLCERPLHRLPSQLLQRLARCGEVPHAANAPATAWKGNVAQSALLQAWLPLGLQHAAKPVKQRCTVPGSSTPACFPRLLADVPVIPIHNAPDEADGFFVWQGRSRSFRQHAARLHSGTGLQAGVHAAGAGGANSRTNEECNAARRKKTRFHGTLWIGTGIR